MHPNYYLMFDRQIIVVGTVIVARNSAETILILIIVLHRSIKIKNVC